MMTLAEALAQVELEPGKTYECLVNGRRVVVRVGEPATTQLAKPFDEADVMLDPWFDLPSGGKPLIVSSVERVRVPFDPPSIPEDDA